MLASAGALRSLDSQQLGRMARQSNPIGEALVCCCIILFADEGRRNSARLIEEASLLLLYLLPCASIDDILILLNDDDISSAGTAMFQSLYQWMVERETIPGRAFEVLALGLHQAENSSEDADIVSWEQQFASRALLQYKREQQTIGSNTNDEENDNGGDEL